MSCQCNRKTIQEKVSGKVGRKKPEKGDGKKSERGGISTMGGEKLAGKGKFSCRSMFFGGKSECSCGQWSLIRSMTYNIIYNIFSLF